jgi:hypothetical protein
MKRTLIIVAPIVITFIAILGYASNVLEKRYFWEPKYSTARTHVPDFKYQIDSLIPFITIVTCEGTLSGKYTHERYVVFQFFGLYGKALSAERSEEESHHP